MLDPETGLFPCRYASKDIDDRLVMVLREDTCCKAPLITGIAIDEYGFIYRNFLEMEWKFPDIDVM